MTPQTAPAEPKRPPEPISLSPVTRAARIGEMVVRETLTPLLLLDLVAHGDMSLVERGLAAITGFDERTIQILLYDRGWIGLRAIFRAAAFEMRHLAAIDTALRMFAEAGGSVARDNRDRHAELCLSRYLTAVAEHAPAEVLDEVLTLLIEIGAGLPKLPDATEG